MWCTVAASSHQVTYSTFVPPHCHITTFDPNLEREMEECTGRANEKEGREE